jgi:hypothetical protein
MKEFRQLPEECNRSYDSDLHRRLISITAKGFTITAVPYVQSAGSGMTGTDALHAPEMTIFLDQRRKTSRMNEFNNRCDELT